MKCSVIGNIQLCPGFSHITLSPQAPMGPIAPGQFVMIRCSGGADPLLRRPMSVAESAPDGSSFGLIVQRVGKGTDALSKLAAGEVLDVIGPFGSGFKVPDAAGDIMIVAGGTGVAPFLGLVPRLISSGKRVHVLLGARSAGLVLMEEKFRAMGSQVHVATEDGSRGFDGLVTGLLERELDRMEDLPDLALTCGPAGMMRAAASIAERMNIPCQASLENRMACGFGACLGCVTHARGEQKYVTVCHKGPVFDSREVEI